MNVLILSSHPDDETIGMGGTINKLSKQGHKISLCVVTDGSTHKDGNEERSERRRNDCKKVAKFLGISETIFLDYPDMRLDTIPHLEINKELETWPRKNIDYNYVPNDLEFKNQINK